MASNLGIKHIWVRSESRHVLETLRQEVEVLHLATHGTATRISLSTVEYLLHALYGLAPWPENPADVLLVPFLLRALHTHFPHADGPLADHARRHGQLTGGPN